MQFNIQEWRKIYNKVQVLGNRLKDSHPKKGQYNESIPALHPLSADEQLQLEEEINSWLNRSNSYLDACALYAAKPKWQYNKDDPTTWVSSRDFKYQDLLNEQAYKYVVAE